MRHDFTTYYIDTSMLMLTKSFYIVFSLYNGNLRSHTLLSLSETSVPSFILKLIHRIIFFGFVLLPPLSISILLYLHTMLIHPNGFRSINYLLSNHVYSLDLY